MRNWVEEKTQRNWVMAWLVAYSRISDNLGFFFCGVYCRKTENKTECKRIWLCLINSIIILIFNSSVCSKRFFFLFLFSLFLLMIIFFLSSFLSDRFSVQWEPCQSTMCMVLVLIPPDYTYRKHLEYVSLAIRWASMKENVPMLLYLVQAVARNKYVVSTVSCTKKTSCLQMQMTVMFSERYAL